MADDAPVPSPTFTLVQVYEPKAGPVIWHFDLYRLSDAAELTELGWDEALAEGVSLVEWPERAGDALPDTALRLELETVGSGRRAAFKGGREWSRRLAGTLAA